MSDDDTHKEDSTDPQKQPRPTPPPGVEPEDDPSKAETRPFARTPKWLQVERERARDKSETRPLAGINPEQLSQQMPRTTPPPEKEMPPPIATTAKKKKRRSGCITALAVLGGIFLILLLLFSFAMYQMGGAFARLGSTGGPYGTPTWHEEVVAAGKGERKIAVIDVKGIIIYDAGPFDVASASMIINQLLYAKEDPKVAAIIIDMNTPGGEVTASDEIHHAIRAVRASGKPVITCMHAMGASGGYFVAAGSDYIIANRLTITGSIGVIVGTLNYSGLFERYGLESEIYTSGELKAFLHGGTKRTAEEKQLVQDLVMQNYREFAAIVAEGRDAYATQQEVLQSPFADGRILTGAEAMKLKLVDQLGYFQDSIDKAREFAGILDAPVVRYRASRSISDFLFSMQNNGNLNLRSLLPSFWRHLQPGCLYYLAPNTVH